MKIYIGCSGYNYKEWKTDFYPEDLSQNKWLEFYSRHFNTVEINNTFYKFPNEKHLRTWLNKTPVDFKFTIKANRFFTHLKKFITDESFLGRLKDFNDVLNKFKEKTACILWQFPGNLHKDLPRLRSFCESLDRDIHHIVEFRHESWFTEPVYEILRDEDITYCILSAPNNLPEDLVTTSSTAYLRLHGKSTWYDYYYSDAELEEWKNRLERLAGIERLFVYFNNDQHGNAFRNALKLKSLFQSPDMNEIKSMLNLDQR